MLKIALDDSNKLYSYGMRRFLEQIFMKNEKAIVFSELNKVNAANVDIIVKYFIAGEEYVCPPTLKLRNKPGLIIGLYEGNKDYQQSNLPKCIQNIIFINRNESVSNISEHIYQAFINCDEKHKKITLIKCIDCKYKSLTAQQIMVARYTLRGNNTKQIAMALDISVKTVSAHKRLLMKNFDLASDSELLTFLKYMKKNSPQFFRF